MILPFTHSLDKDPKSIFTISTETVIFGIVGIALGSVIDEFFGRYTKDQTVNIKILLAILQLLVSGVILAAMYIYVSEYFVEHFQKTLSGAVFPALFYGVQSNFYVIFQPPVNPPKL